MVYIYNVGLKGLKNFMVWGARVDEVIETDL